MNCLSKEYGKYLEDITQEQAFDQNFDAREAEMKAEIDPDEPFNAEKLGDRCLEVYGWRPSQEHCKQWFDEYCKRNLSGDDIEPYDFVLELELNDL